MSNRVTLAQSLEMPVSEVAALPIEQIALLLEDVVTLKAHAKRCDEHLFTAMKHRVGDAAAAARNAAGKDTGTVRIADGDYVILADLPKKVGWDQDGLRQVERQLADMGEPASDYISVKRDVAERSFEAWPNSLKKMFAPHRTVSVGKPTFKVELKKDAG